MLAITTSNSGVAVPSSFAVSSFQSHVPDSSYELVPLVESRHAHLHGEHAPLPSSSSSSTATATATSHQSASLLIRALANAHARSANQAVQKQYKKQPAWGNKANTNAADEDEAESAIARRMQRTAFELLLGYHASYAPSAFAHTTNDACADVRALLARADAAWRMRTSSAEADRCDALRARFESIAKETGNEEEACALMLVLHRLANAGSAWRQVTGEDAPAPAKDNRWLAPAQAKWMAGGVAYKPLPQLAEPLAQSGAQTQWDAKVNASLASTPNFLGGVLGRNDESPASSSTLALASKTTTTMSTKATRQLAPATVDVTDGESSMWLSIADDPSEEQQNQHNQNYKQDVVDASVRRHRSQIFLEALRCAASGGLAPDVEAYRRRVPGVTLAERRALARIAEATVQRHHIGSFVTSTTTTQKSAVLRALGAAAAAVLRLHDAHWSEMLAAAPGTIADAMGIGPGAGAPVHADCGSLAGVLKATAAATPQLRFLARACDAGMEASRAGPAMGAHVLESLHAILLSACASPGYEERDLTLAWLLFQAASAPYVAAIRSWLFRGGADDAALGGEVSSVAAAPHAAGDDLRIMLFDEDEDQDEPERDNGYDEDVATINKENGERQADVFISKANDTALLTDIHTLGLRLPRRRRDGASHGITSNDALTSSTGVHALALPPFLNHVRVPLLMAGVQLRALRRLAHMGTRGDAAANGMPTAWAPDAKQATAIEGWSSAKNDILTRFLAAWEELAEEEEGVVVTCTDDAETALGVPYAPGDMRSRRRLAHEMQERRLQLVAEALQAMQALTSRVAGERHAAAAVARERLFAASEAAKAEALLRREAAAKEKARLAAETAADLAQREKTAKFEAALAKIDERDAMLSAEVAELAAERARMEVESVASKTAMKRMSVAAERIAWRRRRLALTHLRDAKLREIYGEFGDVTERDEGALMEAQAEALAEALELAGDDPSAVLLDDNMETTSSALENDATSDTSVQGTDEVAADADKTLEGEFVRNDNNEEENESVTTTPLKTPETEAVMSPDTAHEEEMLFRKHLLEKFAEDDRIEQMNAQRRRMKMEEHKREVQRLWEEKQAGSNLKTPSAPSSPPAPSTIVEIAAPVPADDELDTKAIVMNDQEKTTTTTTTTKTTTATITTQASAITTGVDDVDVVDDNDDDNGALSMLPADSIDAAVHAPIRGCYDLLSAMCLHVFVDELQLSTHMRRIAATVLLLDTGYATRLVEMLRFHQGLCDRGQYEPPTARELLWYAKDAMVHSLDAALSSAVVRDAPPPTLAYAHDPAADRSSATDDLVGTEAAQPSVELGRRLFESSHSRAECLSSVCLSYETCVPPVLLETALPVHALRRYAEASRQMLKLHAANAVVLSARRRLRALAHALGAAERRAAATAKATRTERGGVRAHALRRRLRRLECTLFAMSHFVASVHATLSEAAATPWDTEAMARRAAERHGGSFASDLSDVRKQLVAHGDFVADATLCPRAYDDESLLAPFSVYKLASARRPTEASARLVVRDTDDAVDVARHAMEVCLQAVHDFAREVAPFEPTWSETRRLLGGGSGSVVVAGGAMNLTADDDGFDDGIAGSHRTRRFEDELLASLLANDEVHGRCREAHSRFTEATRQFVEVLEASSGAEVMEGALAKRDRVVVEVYSTLLTRLDGNRFYSTSSSYGE
ncbi:meiosis-specific nuclear structural protein 1 [Pseudoscourfieldia marina]